MIKEYRLHMTRKEMELLYRSLGNISHNHNSHRMSLEIRSVLSKTYNHKYSQIDFMFLLTNKEAGVILYAVHNDNHSGKLHCRMRQNYEDN